MADLTAKFQLIDEMSEKLNAVAESGQSMADRVEKAGQRASDALDGISGTATTASQSVDGIAVSIDNIQSASAEASASADEMASSIEEYGAAMEEAASRANDWTDAVGNYDRSALEAIYTTEELVEMGLKSADALEEQEQMLDLCGRSAESLNKAMEASANIHSDLENAIEKTSSVTKELSGNENLSAETKNKLEQASEQAAEAMEELTRAQQEAETAMQDYDRIISSGTTDLEELEAAAERAGLASEALAEANGRASEATEELSRATENAAEEAKNAEKSGTDAIDGIANALAAAGITATVKEISTAVYEMADSFSEAEKMVGTSTGATGKELDNLIERAQNIYANSNAENLEEIASGMASIAKATGLAGEELEETTSKGYALQDLFDYEMSESARTASALMKNFNISAAEAYDIIAAGAQNGADKNGDLLDILNEYSAQYAALGLSADEFVSSLVAGADAGVFSVDKVGDAVKEFNIRAKDGSDTSAEAFELLGMNADIMTAKFAAGGETASKAFFDVVSALESMDDPVQKNAAAVGLFGTMYEDLEATILPVLANIQGGTVDTADALSRISENAQSMSDGWKQAGNSVETAFSTTISPALEDASNEMSGLMKEFGDFLNEHPTVTKAITAVGAGFAAAAVGIAGVSAASLAATPVIAALGTTIGAALGPITLITAGVTAATAIVLTLADKGEDASERLTYASRKQEEELERLNSEYEETAKKYGATSEQAGELSLQISQLEDSYSQSRRTIGEFADEIEAAGKRIADTQTQYDDAISSASDLESGSINLASQLMVLSGRADLTGTNLDLMKGIVDKLNASYGDLALSVDETTGKLNMSVPDLYGFIQDKADEQKKAAATNGLTEAIAAYGEAQERMQNSYAEAGAAWDTYKQLEEQWQNEHPILSSLAGNSAMNWDDDLGAAFDDWEALKEESASVSNEYDQLNDEIKQYCEALGYSAEETEEFISQLEASADAMETFGETAEESAESTVTAEEACAEALSTVQDRLDELTAAYDEAYEAALSSFEGQFGLFDKASTKSEEYKNATVSNAQAALDSQLAYWESYNANLETLTSYGEGLTGEAKENYEALLQYVSDGSEEAAGLAASMSKAISSGNEEAVAALASTIGEVQAKQEEASATVADWQTDFSESLSGLEQEMQEAVDGMDLSEEARESAQATISAYIYQISSSSGEAAKAAESVAQEVKNALLAQTEQQIDIEVNYNLNTERLENYEIPDKTAEASYKLNSSAVDKYVMPDKTAEAEYELNSAEVDAYIPEDKSADAIYEVDSYAVDTWTPPDKTATLTYSVTTSGSIPGHADGTTNAERVFVAGEEGPELVARKAAAYATGTTDSTDFFIAGEKGPELIVGEQGSTVFPTEETEKIINAVSEPPEQNIIVAEPTASKEPAGFFDRLEALFASMLDKLSTLRGAGTATGDSYDYHTADTYASENAYNTENIYHTENYGGDSYDASYVTNAYRTANAYNTENLFDTDNTYTEDAISNTYEDSYSYDYGRILNASNEENSSSENIENRYDASQDYGREYHFNTFEAGAAGALESVISKALETVSAFFDVLMEKFTSEAKETAHGAFGAADGYVHGTDNTYADESVSNVYNVSYAYDYGRTLDAGSETNTYQTDNVENLYSAEGDYGREYNTFGRENASVLENAVMKALEAVFAVFNASLEKFTSIADKTAHGAVSGVQSYLNGNGDTNYYSYSTESTGGTENYTAEDWSSQNAWDDHSVRTAKSSESYVTMHDSRDFSRVITANRSGGDSFGDSSYDYAMTNSYDYGMSNSYKSEADATAYNTGYSYNNGYSLNAHNEADTYRIENIENACSASGDYSSRRIFNVSNRDSLSEQESLISRALSFISGIFDTISGKYSAGEEKAVYKAVSASQVDAGGVRNALDDFDVGGVEPELIIPDAEKADFIPDSTEDIASITAERKPLFIPPAEAGGEGTDAGRLQGVPAASEKRFVIDINGNGKIEVTGNGVTRQDVVDILIEKIRPILLDIISSEEYEEGDLSYEF